jgi:homocysteine S-methyltransferase
VNFLEALQTRVLLADGGTGTVLSKLGVTNRPYDLANLDAPELVAQVHREYLIAGADIIETNTYQATSLRLPEGTRAYEVNRRGGEIATAVVKQFPGRFVFGSIGPSGKTVEPYGQLPLSTLREAISEQVQGLLDGGVNGFILETFIHMHELEAVIQCVRAVTDLPIIASKAFIEDGEALAEGLPAKFAESLSQLGVDVIGANCVVGPQRMLDIVRQLVEVTDVPIFAMPTPGLPQLVKGQVTYDTHPDYFAKATIRLVEEGARMIGGCCGTTPDHIAAIRSLLDQGPIKVRPRGAVKRDGSVKKPLAESEPSPFRKKLGHKFVTAVEMDVPRGLNVGKVVQGAANLRETGVDVINISDGARARLRMSAPAISTLLQRDAGVEVTMHFACRDRNLLAIQSDLLGAHALGIRNILAVTGDPANIGDYPSATSVFDIDSIGLCRILRRFNEGTDLAGYSVGVKCGFTIACAFNPLAADAEEELDRLKRKAEAGAHVIYTQPVFSEDQVEICLRGAQAVGLPVLVGVLPLKSSRHAEFMHHEVPGIVIPDDLRAAVSSADNDEDAFKIGMESAIRLSLYVRGVAHGLYLMPPFGSAEIASEILRSIA